MATFLGLTEFYRVLLDYKGSVGVSCVVRSFIWVLLGFIAFYWVLLDFIGLQRIRWGFSWFYCGWFCSMVLFGWFYWVLTGSTGLRGVCLIASCLVWLSLTEFYLMELCFTGFYWVLTGSLHSLENFFQMPTMPIWSPLTSSCQPEDDATCGMIQPITARRNVSLAIAGDRSISAGVIVLLCLFSFVSVAVAVIVVDVVVVVVVVRSDRFLWLFSFLFFFFHHLFIRTRQFLWPVAVSEIESIEQQQQQQQQQQQKTTAQRWGTCRIRQKKRKKAKRNE